MAELKIFGARNRHYQLGYFCARDLTHMKKIALATGFSRKGIFRKVDEYSPDELAALEDAVEVADFVKARACGLLKFDRATRKWDFTPAD